MPGQPQPLPTPPLAGYTNRVNAQNLHRSPPPPALPLRIFISAAEPSGDQHAAELIQRIREQSPQAHFYGVAGPRMQAAGCEPIDDLTDRSAMLLGAVGLAGHAWRLLHRIRREMACNPPALAIVVDSPTLHLPMAKILKRAGLPVLYYIAPQLWAWAPWRIRRLRARVDHVAAILPFEEAYFRQRGVDATFVGHPLVEQLQSRRIDPARVREYQNLGMPIIACLPGSRRHVVSEVLPGQIEVARQIAQQHPRAAFLFAAANPAAAQTITAALERCNAGRPCPATSTTTSAPEGPDIAAPPGPATLERAPLRARVEIDRNAEILSAADLALCASGTATLEVAYYGVPMVVMYNGSKWGYRLVGRFLIQTPHLSLVNILAGRAIVPEFMPYYTSTAPIAAEALDLLANTPRRERMKHDLAAVIASLGPSSAAQGAARLALELVSSARPEVRG